MNRRTGRIVAALVVVALAVAIIGGIAFVRLSGTMQGSTFGAPHFVDEAASAGLDHTYGGEFDYATGGGVAVFDCDGDGRQDLYLAGGGNAAALYRNQSPIGGALRFAATHDPVTDLTGVNGAYPIDIDGDGQIDLAVLRMGGASLLRGLGDCRFEPADERWSFDGGSGWASAFSATWEPGSTLPSLAVGEYRGLDGTGTSTLDCADNRLVRPDGRNERYAPPIRLAPGFCALSMLFSDWDRSGRRDLRVSNDRHYYDQAHGEEQLWRIEAGQPPRLYTRADGWMPLQIEGMGIGSYDVTGDGYPDVYLTTQGANRLQALTVGPTKPTFGDIGLKHNVNVIRPFTGGDDLPSTAWHPEFQDVNNDGFIDLFVSKGNIDEVPDSAARDPSNLLLGQPDGTFVEGADTAGILSFAKGRGAALADLNLDGLPDLVEVNYGDPVKLWRNVGAGNASAPAAMGHWLGLGISQPGPNRDAIGSWVEVQAGDATMRREVTIGGGHEGGQLGWLHFGLGRAESAKVRVQWPDGEWGPWLDVPADGFSEIERGATEARPWRPSE